MSQIALSRMTNLTVPQIAAWQLPDIGNDLPEGQKLEWAAALPSLQRGAVWKPGKIELFWDSLFRGFPVGSLVIAKQLEQQHSTYGKLGGKTDPWPQLGKRHLLDGQQRANAIAIGFYDPFSGKEPVPDECILWIDLKPDSFPTGSTRQFLFRVTTPAHPWGYTKGDDAGRIETWRMRETMEKAGWHAPANKKYERPKPRELFPCEAEIPIPLAWLLRGILQNQSGEKLWAPIRERCAKSMMTKAATKYLQELDLPNLKMIECAAERAIKATIAILEVPEETISAPTHQQADASAPEQNISNIEHLFQRLNNGGTPISSDDLRYSMIKAYWPGIETTIDAIKPLPMPAARLVSLGARAAKTGEVFIKEGVLPESFPGDISTESLRSMAMTKQANALMQYFGLSGENGLQEDIDVNIPFVRIIKIIDSWLLYRGDGDIGCPPALRTQIAKDSPDVYLLLMIFAQLVINNQGLAEEIRKSILGLTTTLHWFSRDKGRAIRSIYARLRESEPLDKSFFSGCLNEVQNQNSIANGFYKIISPAKLREFVKCPHENTEDWNFWREIVEDRSESDETKRAELHNEVWPVVRNILWNNELLLWAQRSYMKERFGNYDKADAVMWARSRMGVNDQPDTHSRVY